MGVSKCTRDTILDPRGPEQGTLELKWSVHQVKGNEGISRGVAVLNAGDLGDRRVVCDSTELCIHLVRTLR